MKILNNILRTILLKGVLVYQKACSPFLPQCCRFYPSCSEYAAQCIEKLGVKKGVPRALKRLLRCHPGTDGGFDPVD